MYKAGITLAIIGLVSSCAAAVIWKPVPVKILFAALACFDAAVLILMILRRKE